MPLGLALLSYNRGARGKAVAEQARGRQHPGISAKAEVLGHQRQSVGAVGTSIYAGWVFDRTSGYQWGLIPLLALFLIAAQLFWFLPQPRRAIGG